MTVVTAIKWSKQLLHPNDITSTIATLDRKLKTGDLFINALQLAPLAQENPFIKALLNETEKKISKTDLFKFYNRTLFNKNGKILVFAIFLVFVPSFFFTQTYLFSTVRMILPWFEIEKRIVKIEYTVLPGNIRLPTGQDVEILLSTPDDLISCMVYYKSGQKNYLMEEMPVYKASRSNYIYSFTLSEINRDVQYHIKMISSFRQTIVTPNYKIQTVHPPVINSIRLRLAYPTYTGLDQSIQEDNGHIEALKGTMVYWSAKASAPLSKGTLIIGNNVVNCRVMKDEISCSFNVEKNTYYFSRIVDLHQVSNIMPVVYTIRLIEDAKPKVTITQPGRNIDLPDDMMVTTQIEASDDLRIRSLQFKYYVVRGYSSVSDRTNIRELSITDEKETAVSYELGLKGLELTPGDSVFYFAVVDDGYPFDNSHKVSSDVFTVKFPSMSDLFKQVDKEEEQIVDILQSIRNKQEEYFSKIQDLQKQLDQGGNMDYVARKQLESILEKQKNLMEQTKNASQNLEKTADKIEKNDMASRQIVEKMREIEKMMREVVTKDMKETMEKLQESIKNMELSPKEKQNLAAKLDQKEMIRKLDNTLKMLKEARETRKLQELSRRAEDVLKKQNEINKTTSEMQILKKIDDKSLEQLQNKQAENKKSLDDLKNELDKAVSENKDLNKETSKKMQDARSMLEQKQTSSKMDKISDKLAQKDMESAKSEQEKVSQDLKDLQKTLAQEEQNREKQSSDKLIAAFDMIIFDLMALAGEQADTTSSIIKHDVIPFSSSTMIFSTSPKTSITYKDLAEKQLFLEKKIVSDKKLIRQELEKSIMISDLFYKQFDLIAAQMQIVVKYLGENNPYLAKQASSTALQMLHFLILQILETYDNVKNQMKSAKNQNMGDAMEKMSKDQECLNDSSQQMMGQSSKEGMTPAMQQYLKELAFQQEMIQSAFDDTINRNKEEAGKLLGNMSALSKEMEDVAQKMKSGEISQDIVDRQKKILKKLLDSQKSLKIKEESSERKADRPVRDIQPRPPTELHNDKPDDKSTIKQLNKKEKYPVEYLPTIENYFKLLKED